MKADQIHREVREGYARVVRQDRSCCGSAKGDAAKLAREIGYEESDLQGVAGEANLGLGCGNPTAIADLKEGEVVVDLGSGAGFDALLAAPRIGESGRFIGVDMTPEMLERARTNAVKAGFARTVEFREGLIENLPIASGSVDVVISNCVINLSPDKGQVFREIFRVLKPGGRLAVSDVILAEPLPNELRERVDAWVGCIAGALSEEEYLGHIRAAGFTEPTFERTPAGALLSNCCGDPTLQKSVAKFGTEQLQRLANTIFSYAIQASRP